MSRPRHEVDHEIGVVRRMPYGQARSSAAQRLVTEVEADGPPESRAYAYATLVEAYVWGGEVEKAFVPFTRSLRWADEHPEHLDETDWHMHFWSFKWMVADLMEYPAVPAEQIERTLEDMARRYAVAGNGTDAVAHQRFVWASARGAQDTEEAYQAWVSTARDEYSQCEACDPGDRAVHLFETGRTQEGIRLVERVLEDDPRCATEPADMLSWLALAYLDVGREDDAVRTHRRALVHLEEAEGDLTGARGRHVEWLARAGQPRAAVRRIEVDQRWLSGGATPQRRLDLLTSVGAAAHLLSLGDPDLTVRLTEVPATTVAELAAWCRAEAEPLADAFDRRNGTPHARRALAQRWTLVPTRTPLELSVLPPSAAAPSTAGTPAVASVDAVAPQADAATFSALLSAAERAVGTGDLATAAGVHAQAAQLATDAGRLADAGFALAEAARCAQLLQDHEGADRAYARAVDLLRVGGVGPAHRGPVVRAWAPSAARTGTAEAVLVELDRLATELDAEGPDGGLGTAGQGADRSPGPVDERLARTAAAVRRERADLTDTAARLLAELGRREQAAQRARQVAEEYAALGAVADAAHAFWLAGGLLAAAGDVDDAVWHLESAVEGFAMVGDRDQRARVAGELIDLLRANGRTAQADDVAAGLMS